MAGRNLFADEPVQQQPQAGRNLFGEGSPAVGVNAPQMSTSEDIARSTGSGLLGGSADLVGTPGTISDIMNAGFGGLLRKGYQGVTGAYNMLQGEGFTPEEPTPGSFFAGNAIPPSIGSGSAVRQGIDTVANGATSYEPRTTAGEYAKTASTFVPGAAAFGGVSPSNLIRYGVIPGLASEGAGQLTEGTAAEPYARMSAALLAPFVTPGSGAGKLLAEGVRKVVSPLRAPVAPERQALIDILNNEGVDLTAGQMLGSKALKYRESQTGGRAAENFMENQGEQFTSAIMKRIGSNSTRATPDAINEAGTRIGKMFDDLSANNNIIPDQKLTSDLGDTLREYVSTTSETSRIPYIRDKIADIVTDATKGPINGKKYQELASELGSKIKNASGAELEAYQGLRGALDDAMERSIASTNPGDLGLWQEARNSYRNLLVVEKAVTGAGEEARHGIISPAQLRSAVTNIGGRRNFARGQGDFADLARAGEGMMAPLPQSGTANRLMAAAPLAGGGGAGALIGSLIGGGLPGAIVGAGVGMAAPHLASRALMSKSIQSILANQARAGSGQAALPYASVVNALVNAEMRRQGGQ